MRTEVRIVGSDNEGWIMRGMDPKDPRCVRTPDALTDAVNEAGFLPLFRNSVPGFSVEERTAPSGWWTGDEATDPWEWRRLLADSGLVAYGKFFDRKAGFISLAWLPDFLNWRRDGYDFDARWEDEKAPFRQKKIMDLFADGQEWYSFDLKRKAGFGPGGEKNFEGVLTDLMMQGYLTVRDFRCRLNRQGMPYGWHVAVYATPEKIWGYDRVTAAYARRPEESRQRILMHPHQRFPGATDAQLGKIMKFGAQHGESESVRSH